MCFGNNSSQYMDAYLKSQNSLTGQLPATDETGNTPTGNPGSDIDYRYNARNTRLGLQQGSGLLGMAPNSIPDFSDPSIQRAYQSQVLSQNLKRGRSSTFLSTDSGGGQPVTGNSTILGG